MAAARCSVIILGVTVPVRAVEGLMMSACGYRYVIALDGYFVEEYEVWESISDVVFPLSTPCCWARLGGSMLIAFLGFHVKSEMRGGFSQRRRRRCISCGMSPTTT